MAIDIIDPQMHLTAFPPTYTGVGTVIGNTYYTVDAQLLSGYFTSDGNVTQIAIGFVPQDIELINVTGVATYQWRRGLPAGSTIKRVTGGTMTIDTTSLITVVNNIANGTSVITFSASALGTAQSILFRVLG